MKLVIGRMPNGDDLTEFYVDGNDDPRGIKNLVRSVISNPMNTKVICTFSPVAIDAFVNAHKDDSHFGYGNIFVRKDGKDVCVNKLKDPAWLAHFSLAELYMDGEI